MPNLHELGRSSFVCTDYYSIAGRTNYGWCALFNGRVSLRGVTSPRDTELPPALLAFLKRLGYDIQLFQSIPIDDRPFFEKWKGTLYESVMLGATFTGHMYDHDRQVIAAAAAALKAARVQATPLAAIIQLNGTHYGHEGYSADPQLSKFEPSYEAGEISLSAPDQTRFLNRYRNACYTIDQALEASSRALLTASLSSPGITRELARPGRSVHLPRRNIERSCARADGDSRARAAGRHDRETGQPPGCLPTLMDALGYRLDRPELLHGSSLFDPAISEAKVFFLSNFDDRVYLCTSEEGPVYSVAFNVRQPRFYDSGKTSLFGKRAKLTETDAPGLSRASGSLRPAVAWQQRRANRVAPVLPLQQKGASIGYRAKR